MSQGKVSFQESGNELTARWFVQYHVSQHLFWGLGLQTQLQIKAGL